MPKLTCQDVIKSIQTQFKGNKIYVMVAYVDYEAFMSYDLIGPFDAAPDSLKITKILDSHNRLYNLHTLKADIGKGLHVYSDVEEFEQDIKSKSQQCTEC